MCDSKQVVCVSCMSGETVREQMVFECVSDYVLLKGNKALFVYYSNELGANLVNLQ